METPRTPKECRDRWGNAGDGEIRRMGERGSGSQGKQRRKGAETRKGRVIRLGATVDMFEPRPNGLAGATDLVGCETGALSLKP
jgi:hypothetical protein